MSKASSDLGRFKHHMTPRGGGLAKSSYNFIVAKKLNLIYSLSCFINGIRRGLAENVRVRSYGGGGLKLLKNRYMIFERSLFAIPLRISEKIRTGLLYFQMLFRHNQVWNFNIKSCSWHS